MLSLAALHRPGGEIFFKISQSRDEWIIDQVGSGNSLQGRAVWENYW